MHKVVTIIIITITKKGAQNICYNRIVEENEKESY